MSDIAAPDRPTLVNWVEVFALGMIWGGSFLAVHVALEGFGPFTVAAGRIALAAAVLSLLCLLRRIPLPRTPQAWAYAGGLAVFSNALPFSLLSWAQQHVTSGFAGISMAMVPLFTLVLAHLALPGERLTVLRLLGFGLGLAGVVVLIGTDALATGGGAWEPVARLACIASTLCYAVGAVLTRRGPKVDPIAFSTAALLIASVLIVPAALIVEGMPAALPAPRAVLAVLYLGALPTALATLILVHVIRTAGPTFLTQTNYHVPLWSVIFGTVVLAEPLPPQFLIALALIFAGLLVSRARMGRAGR